MIDNFFQYILIFATFFAVVISFDQQRIHEKTKFMLSKILLNIGLGQEFSPLAVAMSLLVAIVALTKSNCWHVGQV